MSVRRRPYRQDREGLPARPAEPTANQNPAVPKIVRLFASQAVTDDGPVAADGTPSRQQSQRERGHPGIGLVFALGQCDKKNQGRREGPPLFNALPKVRFGYGPSPSVKLSVERKEYRFPTARARPAQTLKLPIGRYSGKFCIIAGRPVNKGLGMLHMSSAK